MLHLSKLMLVTQKVQLKKCIVAGDKVHKDKDVLVSNEELESVIENLAEAYRKKSGIIIEVTALSFKLKCKSNFKVNIFLVSFSFAGNSERPASRRQVDMESPNRLAGKCVQKLSTTLVDLIGRKMPGTKMQIPWAEIKMLKCQDAQLGRWK